MEPQKLSYGMSHRWSGYLCQTLLRGERNEDRELTVGNFRPAASTRISNHELGQPQLLPSWNSLSARKHVIHNHEVSALLQYGTIVLMERNILKKESGSHL